MEEEKDAEGHYSGVSSPSFPNSPSGRQRRSKLEEFKMSTSFKVPHGQVTVRKIQHTKTASVDCFDELKDLNVQKGIIDTAAPFESVKEAVSKFGGILDWKAHKVIALEKSKIIQNELEKIGEDIPKYKKQSEATEDAKEQALDELERTKRLVEELKHSLEKAETEEAEAKQDSELAQLRAREMAQGISEDASVAAKAQAEVSKARHDAAVRGLKSVKDELAALKGDHHRLVTERDSAIARAREAVSAAEDAEKKVEDLTLELITTKEALESAHASHLETEDRRIELALGEDRDAVDLENELKQAECEAQRLTEQILSANDLKSKLDASNTLLLDLKSELAAYMEETDTGTTRTALASAKNELEEVRNNIEKAKEEIKFLRVAASSLKSELDREIETLTALRECKGMTAVSVLSLEAELSRMQPELDTVLANERDAREKMEELPKLIQQATQDADKAKSVAHFACEELEKAKEDASQAKAGSSSAEVRLRAALKEIEASKSTEKLALAAIKAMEDSDSPGGGDKVTLSLEEYYTLSKNAHDAEQLANERVISAAEQISDAKKSELSSLERLEEAHKEREEKKAALRTATEKEEGANERKLRAEQALRDWRAENEERRRAADAAPAQSPSSSSSGYFEESDAVASKEVMLGVDSVSDTSRSKKEVVPELKPRKKRSFIPRFVMFLARKKVETLKS